MTEVLTESKTKSSSKDLIKIWEKPTEELLGDIKSYYETIENIDKQNVINEKTLNEKIRYLQLSLEELIKRGELPYGQRDVCNVITGRLKNCSKNIRVIVARQLDSRFKREYTKPILDDTDASNVTAVTFPTTDNEDAQSGLLFENAKSNISYIKSHLNNFNPSDVQDLQEIASNLNNALTKHCKENKIQTVELDSQESELDRLRKQAKGEPIPCPTPHVEQKQIRIDNKTDQEILSSLKTESAKEIFLYGITWRNIALNVDNYPPELEGDDHKIAQAFKSRRELIECSDDIKIKRDNAQWAEIVNKYQEISKHNAASNEELDVYGVSCSNCGSRMKPIDKKRDHHRLYWRCPNYYRTEEQFVKCKLDEPVNRNVSKERITEIHKAIVNWAVDCWNTNDVFDTFLYYFRNYKQPYHTEHTKLLEPKFQRRGA